MGFETMNEYGVSYWGHKNVLNLESGDECTAQ